jgi:glucosylglycerate synthase
MAREVGLAEENLLTDEFLRQLINIGEVDIVVGLSTHNHAKTIGPVIEAIQAGILKCFPRERVAIINADGGSHDGTTELVTNASIDDLRRSSKLYALRTLHCISVRYGGLPDPSKALQTILAGADLLRAKACVMISPDSTTIEPDWLQHLVRPVYSDNFDLVCPIYQRQKFEGALVRNLLYPMTRSIYGMRIREPYGSEVAISGRLAADFLSNGIMDQDWVKMGPEISTTVFALTGKYRVCQSFLGPKPASSRSAHDMVAAMRRTVGALFASLDGNFPFWSAISGSQVVPTVGTPTEAAEETARINRKRLLEMFASGVAQLGPVLNSILSAPLLAELQRIAALGIDEFEYPAELWTRTVFEFAASYHQSTISRDHIIQALVPLYRGRSLTFVMENRDGSAEEIERREESLCADFERLKPYLLEIWANRK